MGISAFPTSDMEKGSALLQQGKVGEIVFSGGTYQVEVVEGKKSFWPFLQIDLSGKIKDHFCTCVAAEEQGTCPHQAAAWLKIFNGSLAPLHVRFKESLWNQLCLIASRRHGYEAAMLKGDLKPKFQALSQTGKKLFFLQPKNEKGRKKAREFILQRRQETEETSLKFSNLSPEELKLWKEGRPTQELEYELSFWSDLAKWWMVLQEAGEKYKIEFHYVKEGLPKGISVHFEEVEFGFYIAEVNWPFLIPSLKTVEAPLKVFDFTPEQIKRLVYDPLRKVFLLDIPQPAPGSEEHREKEKTCAIGEWTFVAKQGFYPTKRDPLLKEKVIHQHQIGDFLQKHLSFIQRHLVGTKISPSPIKAKYHLFFDEVHTLHVVCYLFEIGDLQKLSSAYFGPWVYLGEKGFYQIEDPLFEGVEKVVPKEHLSDFINRHRHWLHAYEGFQTHVGNIESHLTYFLSPQKELHFETKLELVEEAEETLDLGDWIYVKGSGFYSKVSKKQAHLLKPGLVVVPTEIPAFIYAHREELESVAGFFTTTSPIQKSGLNLFLNTDQQIVVEPEYAFTPAYTGKEVEIFENFTYVEKEGFCEIAPDYRLPIPYFKRRVIEASAEPYFASFEIDTLKPYISNIDPKLRKPKELYLRLRKIEKQEGMWLVELDYESEVGVIDIMTLWEAMNHNQRHIFSSAGLILLKNPRFNWLKGIPKKRWMKKGEQIQLTTLEWVRLFVFEEIREPEDEQSRQFLEEFIHFRTSIPYSTEGLQSVLRLYQETGLKWLWFLYCHGLSGLLCDEMGLGKTHQAMALLAAAQNQKEGGKFLVVCPTSVIYHWQELLKRFLPKLRVHVFYGTQRSLADFETRYDLMLTSYGTLRSKKNPLTEIAFDIAIFDEIQIAKNAHSQTHQALKLIEAKTRIGLTGTPIENRLLELKALFDVVLPAYMPTETVFKELFAHPIEKQHDSEKKALLARFIRPFVLRRRKAEVLLELPEKTEEIAYASLSQEQKELYQKMYLEAKEQIVVELGDAARPVPYIHVFALLTKLKQICDHPSLILKDTDHYKRHQSGKWDLFVELLQGTRDSGQKLVVFSQYLGMLDIIENYLAEEKIGFAALRGSTRDRKREIEKFRDDPKCEVFVGSLQAAGVGIDLIAASVVIHYDRWWNPAKENQATDRVHRIGQSRGVQVFKMVTKNTIEEHIHQLIEKKLALLENILGYDDQNQIKSLSRDELLELMRLMEPEFLNQV
jgi:superfamily II DNA or RNA helicase